MKKTILFILSVIVAIGITFYTKSENSKKMVHINSQWKTFVKKDKSVVDSHGSTQEEFQAAKIPPPPTPSKAQRTIAAINPYQGFLVRNNRIVMGDLDKKYEDENTELQMSNSVNPDWKEVMGNDLMRFQSTETKLMVKEEVPVIKIVNGIGRYLEQVTITYLQKDGNRSSFKALVDSETGAIVETWDRTIHEHIRSKRGGLTLPLTNDSGIITR